MRDYSKLIISIAVCQFVALLGSLVTFPSIRTWYQTLNKPDFNPPNWIFGPVWTILFILMGVSAYLVWEKGLKKKDVRSALGIFLIQLVLNFLWSYIFFGLHSIRFAFSEIIVLWSAILFTILKFWPISRNAAYLLLPYLFWVSFAAVLNFYILRLN